MYIVQQYAKNKSEKSSLLSVMHVSQIREEACLLSMVS